MNYILEYILNTIIAGSLTFVVVYFMLQIIDTIKYWYYNKVSFKIKLYMISYIVCNSLLIGLIIYTFLLLMTGHAPTK